MIGVDVKLSDEGKIIIIDGAVLMAFDVTELGQFGEAGAQGMDRDEQIPFGVKAASVGC